MEIWKQRQQDNAKVLAVLKEARVTMDVDDISLLASVPEERIEDSLADLHSKGAIYADITKGFMLYAAV